MIEIVIKSRNSLCKTFPMWSLRCESVWTLMGTWGHYNQKVPSQSIGGCFLFVFIIYFTKIPFLNLPSLWSSVTWLIWSLPHWLLPELIQIWALRMQFPPYAPRALSNTLPHSACALWALWNKPSLLRADFSGDSLCWWITAALLLTPARKKKAIIF